MSRTSRTLSTCHRQKKRGQKQRTTIRTTENIDVENALVALSEDDTADLEADVQEILLTCKSHDNCKENSE